MQARLGRNPGGCGRLVEATPVMRLSVQRVALGKAHRSSGRKKIQPNLCCCQNDAPLSRPTPQPLFLPQPLLSLVLGLATPPVWPLPKMPSFVAHQGPGGPISWHELGLLGRSGVFAFQHLQASEDQAAPTWLLGRLRSFITAVAAAKNQVGLKSPLSQFLPPLVSLMC